MAESSSDDIARRFFGNPGPADERSQRCLEAIRRALEEHGCELQVWTPVGVGDQGRAGEPQLATATRSYSPNTLHALRQLLRSILLREHRQVVGKPRLNSPR
jgi:hypothetical protein